jgi:hypothetical protein
MPAARAATAGCFLRLPVCRFMPVSFSGLSTCTREAAAGPQGDRYC